MGGSVPAPLTNAELQKMLDEMEREMARSWAVYVTFDYNKNEWLIGKIVPWRGRLTTITRFPDDIHKVEAGDEMEAYTIMRRVLDKLEYPL